MKLKIIGTGSKGNAYALTSSTGEILLIEAGVNFKTIHKAIDFKCDNVAGCIVTHSHLDHAKSIEQVIDASIDVYSNQFTIDLYPRHHRLHAINEQTNIGSYTVVPFAVQHDVPCNGYLIYHNECGKVLFLTDTKYSKYKFSGLNNIIVEANYSNEIIQNLPGYKQFLKDRIINSHMSIETSVNLLEANDLSSVNNIVLIHLSDSNSDEEMFKTKVSEATGKTPIIATNGLEINFNLKPF